MEATGTYNVPVFFLWKNSCNFWGLCCLFRESCNIRELYVACLGCLAIYGDSMLLVWVVLQYRSVLCCLFRESCNIERLYVACLGSLAILEAHIYLVWVVLINTGLIFILFGQS